MITIKLKAVLIIIIAILLAVSSITPAKADLFDALKDEKEALKLISSSEEAEKLFEKARKLLAEKLKIKVYGPVQIKLVTAQKLDELCTGIYRGTHIGLYKYENGIHCLYVMKNLNKDRFLATAVHEFTHAWQRENCPSTQDEILREGFANWVAYKFLHFTGGYAEAIKIQQNIDPVYGTGFKIVLKLEDEMGTAALIDYVKTTVKLPSL